MKIEKRVEKKIDVLCQAKEKERDYEVMQKEEKTKKKIKKKGGREQNK